MNKLRSIHVSVARALIPVWLVLLYPLLVWTVVGTLSAQGFQEKVKQLMTVNSESSRGGATVTEVLLHAERLQKAATKKIDLQNRLKTVQSETRKFEMNKIALSDEQVQLEGKQAELLVTLKKILNVKSIGTLTNLLKEKSIIDIAKDKAILDKEQEEVKKELQNYQEITGRLETIGMRKNNISDKINSVYRQNSREEEIQADIKRVEESIQDLSGNKIIGGILIELRYMNLFGFYLFATMPNQLLTVFLMLSMGALGSLIYITQVYFSGDSEQPFSWYLFRPFLGMVTAVAIFVLAKAGQISIATSSVTDTFSESLNPFFISFLAIISGLLSEQATERIRETGSSFFRRMNQGETGGDSLASAGSAQPTTPPELALRPPHSTGNGSSMAQERWAARLQEAMKDQGKRAVDLLAFVDEGLETVEDWIAEQRPVPYEAQRVISSWLGVPIRYLFTDVAPAASPNPIVINPIEAVTEDSPSPPSVGRNPLETGNSSES